METLQARLRSRGMTLESDSSPITRLPQRPVQSSRTRGVGHEDFGSSFGRVAAASTQPRRSESRTATWSGDSDDELDFLSSPSRHGSSSPRRRRDKSSGPVFTIDHHQNNAGYKPTDLSKMSFKRTTKSQSSGAGSSRDSESSSSFVSKPHVLPTRVPRQPRGTSPSTRKKVDSVRVTDKVPLSERSTNQRPRYPDTSDRDGKDDAEITPRPPRRPQPRPRCKTKKLSQSQSFPELQSSQDTAKPPVVRSRTLQDFPLDLTADVESENGGRKGKGKAKAVPESFPVLSPLSSPIDEPALAVPRRKGKPRENPIAALSPLSSPGGTQPRSPLNCFPTLSPLSSSSRLVGRVQRRSKAKGNASVTSSEESDDDGPPTPSGARRGVRPFPMGTQMLRSIVRSPVKRASSEDGQGTQSTPKRPRRLSDKAMVDEGNDEWGSDDDLSFMDPKVDPSTLCPWCDEVLPSSPTPHLSSLIESARRVSRRDERPRNPRALRAPFTAYVGVCQRHRLETNHIPRAKRKGWPTEIDWNALGGRVAALRQPLQAILDDVDEAFLPGAVQEGPPADAANDINSGRPRKGNVFWQDVTRNVKTKGSRQTTGLRGQFLNFSKTQPGYYGESGYVIIHQTLCNMFPPTAIPSGSTLPLTPTDFLQTILVPEAATRLIMQDLGLSHDAAVATLRESAEYGVSMFPYEQGEDGDLGAGEQMFMERARVRRKEIEEETRQEEEDAYRRASERDSDVMDVDSDALMPTEAVAKPRSRPKPRLKGKHASTHADVEKPRSKASAPKPRSKSSAPNALAVPGGAWERAITLSDSSDVPPTIPSSPVKVESSHNKRRSRSAMTISSDSGDAGCIPTPSTSPKRRQAQPRTPPKAAARPRPQPRPRTVSSPRKPCPTLQRGDTIEDALEIHDTESASDGMAVGPDVVEIRDTESASSDSVQELDGPPPSSSQPQMAFVRWDKKRNAHIRMLPSSDVEPDADDEAPISPAMETTPKAKPVSAAKKRSPGRVASGAGKPPFQKLRVVPTPTAGDTTRKASSSSGGWSRNLRGAPVHRADSFDVVEDSQIGRGKRVVSSSKDKTGSAKEEYHWLLASPASSQLSRKDSVQDLP